jgi:hypothetical protein
MKYLSLLALILLMPRVAVTQDERYFRQIYSGDLLKKMDFTDEKKYLAKLHGPYYELDLNGDKVNEEILFIKKDGEDWVEIYSKNSKDEREKILSMQLTNLGINSELFRMEFKSVSPTTKVLILHYFEGYTNYTEVHSTARIYWVTIENNDLKTLTSYKGPGVFEELQNIKGHYHLRNYRVYLQDFNSDGSKEIVVKSNLNSKVFYYIGKGKWGSFKS